MEHVLPKGLILAAALGAIAGCSKPEPAFLCSGSSTALTAKYGDAGQSVVVHLPGNWRAGTEELDAVSPKANYTGGCSLSTAQLPGLHLWLMTPERTPSASDSLVGEVRASNVSTVHGVVGDISLVGHSEKSDRFSGKNDVLAVSHSGGLTISVNFHADNEANRDQFSSAVKEIVTKMTIEADAHKK